MGSLYRRNGGPPEPLPPGAFDARGDHWTDLANSMEARAACGFVEAPPVPAHDPITHIARWDAGVEAWVVEALPPPPSPRPPPMPDITDRQFGEGLWRGGLITFDAYLAFVGPGTIPGPLMAIIDHLPDDDTGEPTQRKVALGLVTGAREFEFDNPFVAVLRQAFERVDPAWTADHLRDRWLYWSTLKGQV